MRLYPIRFSDLSFLYLIGLVFSQVKFNFMGVAVRIGHGPVLVLSYLAVLAVIIRGKFYVDKATITPQIFLISTAFISLAANMNITSTTYVIGMMVNLIIYNSVLRNISRKGFKAIFFILIMASLFPISDPGDIRPAALFGNCVNLSLILFFASYLLLLLWKKKAFILIMLSIIAYLVFSAGSRGGIVGFASLLLFYIFFSRYDNKKALYLVLASIILFFSFIIYLYYTPSVLAYIDGLVDINFHGRSLFTSAQREELFISCVEESLRRPFGMGLGLSSEYISFTGSTASSPHNAYTKMLLEGGWLFLLSYLALFFMVVSKSRYPVTRAALCAFGIRAFFEIATPFGFSLVSGLLLLPYFIERGLTRQAVFKEGMDYDCYLPKSIHAGSDYRKKDIVLCS